MLDICLSSAMYMVALAFCDAKLHYLNAGSVDAVCQHGPS